MGQNNMTQMQNQTQITNNIYQSAAVEEGKQPVQTVANAKDYHNILSNS